ncbi:uncharacterized protein BDZ99DRAFT_539837 [Mytilinidion resinicola]|uniref:Uncharacterized protein n=1 Tax=Mytilinidion resinicola TaxID=574789 RepID=A0A6A6Y9T5_9PEZI|nr:uncharacterized protein BDZ99DRAFT_539837 [Mytilinidion resinicola]KAF2805460.1 hypothetical protein BDZ99DRAFT_539837 [Mytilinidion resinicola]
MLVAYEWSTYALKRKALRVSEIPKGSQKTSYFLQLPYRFRIPLMATSALLHWLTSQSIYLSSQDILTCGYSPLGILAVIIVGCMMIVAAFVIGRKHFTPLGQPVASSCSASIAASCHREAESDEDDIHLKPVQWGVLKMQNGFGSLGFSSEEVTEVKEGVLYGGTRDEDGAFDSLTFGSR